MPRYDYACKRCGRTIEVTHGVHVAGPSRCEHCGGEMRKLMSSPAIVFKGSGWAKKDRSSKPATTTKAKSDTGSESKPGASTDGQSAKPTNGASGSDSDA